jgi:excisionase family DNA binding protein
MTTSEQTQLLTRRQAAAFMGIKPQTLATWASTGRYSLRFIKVGGRVLYRQHDLEKFLEKRTFTSTNREKH